MNTQLMLDRESMILMCLTGSIFLIILLCFKPYFTSLALKGTKKELKENEHILYIAKYTRFVNYIFPFIAGGFLGCFILPYLIHPELQRLDHYTTRETLPFLILGNIVIILMAISIYFRAIILTNFRIFSLSTFFARGKNKTIWDVKYSDIDFIKLSETFFSQEFYLKTKEGKDINLILISNKQEFKNKIEELSGRKL